MKKTLFSPILGFTQVSVTTVRYITDTRYHSHAEPDGTVDKLFYMKMFYRMQYLNRVNFSFSVYGVWGNGAWTMTH